MPTINAGQILAGQYVQGVKLVQTITNAGPVSADLIVHKGDSLTKVTKANGGTGGKVQPGQTVYFDTSTTMTVNSTNVDHWNGTLIILTDYIDTNDPPQNSHMWGAQFTMIGNNIYKFDQWVSQIWANQSYPATFSYSPDDYNNTRSRWFGNGDIKCP